MPRAAEKAPAAEFLNALQISETRYRRLFEAAQDGILILDAVTGKITDSNPFMTELLSYSREEFVGKELWEIGLLADEEASKAAFIELQTNGYIRYEDRPLDTKSGHRRDIEFVSNVYQEGDRKVIQCNIRDITARRAAETEILFLNTQLEKRVKDRTAQLELANKELESFSHSVSHDLRAPLRHINAFSQALLEDYGDKFDAEGRDYLQQLKIASQEMAQLIDDLLDLAKVSRREMRCESVNLSDVAQDILDRLHRDEPDRKVKVIIEKNLLSNGDYGLLKIMLTNLIGNAWKFTSRREESEIEFGRRTTGEENVFFIRDNGAGFDMAYVDKIFGVFQRLHTTKEFEGTGIGLATVQSIISRHHGRIWPEGVVDEGATFYFTLNSESQN